LMGPVNALAFDTAGQRLVTGGTDGAVWVWDIVARPPRLLARAPRAVPANAPSGLAINALTVSPLGRWVVFGSEAGILVRADLDAPDFENSFTLLPREQGRQAAVEALAFAPDGRLATSILHQRPTNLAERPAEDCDVEIRSMPDGAVMQRILTAGDQVVDNRVHALAFSPKGSYLAFAGGDRQAVYVKDLRDPRKPLVELAGQGSSLWDVGFVDAGPGVDRGPAVAYSYEHSAAAPPAAYWGFAVHGRLRSSYARDQVRRAVPEFDGWTVRPTGPYHLDVLRGGQPAFSIDLSVVSQFEVEKNFGPFPAPWLLPARSIK
jgi:hypothetical protein